MRVIGSLTSRAHYESNVKCSEQARLVFRALTETGFVSVVRWTRGEKDSSVVGQVGSVDPHCDALLLWSAFFWDTGSRQRVMGARKLETA